MEDLVQRKIRYSVIVPAYNADATIGECLAALLHQSISIESYEVLVVDDGSSDRTVEISSRYPVTVLKQAHFGPARARNLGAQVAKGDILLFTDADCEPGYTWIEEIARPLESNPRVGGAKGCYKTRQTGLMARIAQIEFEEKYAELRRHRYIDFIDTSSAAVRKAAFWEAGAFDPSFPLASNEDTALSFSLASRGQLLVFAENAVVYHCHPESIRNYLLRKWRHGYWRVRVYRTYPRKMFGDSYTPKSMQLQMSCMALLLVTIPIAEARAFALVFGIVFLLATTPFIRRAFRVDWRLAPAVPFVFFLRALALGSGLVIGAMAVPFHRRGERALPGQASSNGAVGNRKDE